MTIESLLERSRLRPDGHPVHGPLADTGPPLSLHLAPRAWWQGRYRSTRFAIWDAVTSLIPESLEASTLAIDFGCGMRPFDKVLEFRGYRVLGIDIAGDHADVRGNIEQVPLGSRTVSLALCVNVMQYVAQPLGACQEIVRVLKPGSHFVICLPALTPFDHLDLWRWTGLSAAKLLQDAGLADIGVKPVGTTTGNILHLAALSLRKRIPLAGPPVAELLEIAASRASRSTDQRLPICYAARGTKPAS